MGTIHVTVKLFGTLRKHVPQYNPKKGVEVVLKEGDTLRDLVANLGLPDGENKLFLVRRMSWSPGYQLDDFDEVSIFLPAGGG